MRYPLMDWLARPKGYDFGETTFYGKRHIGIDIIAPEGTPVYCPEDGFITANFEGKEGGGQVHIYTDTGFLLRFLHLKTRTIFLQKKIMENEIIGTVGRTGSLAGKTAHLHFDISRKKLELYNFGNFLNPKEYFSGLNPEKKENKTEIEMRVRISDRSRYGQASGGCSQQSPYEILINPSENIQDNVDVLTHEVLHALFFSAGLGDIHAREQAEKINIGQKNNAAAFDYFLKHKYE